MNEHLDDTQMAALLAGEAATDTNEHVANCAACAAESERLAATLGDWCADLQQGSELPPELWEAQRRAIDSRRGAVAVRTLGAGRFDVLRASESRATRWAVAAAVAATLVLALGFALRPARQAAPAVVASASPTGTLATAPGAPAGNAATADDALLVAVEGALERRAPAELAPAEALLRELDRVRAEGGES